MTPSRFDDNRGSFSETYNKKRFTDETGFEDEFVQDNESFSARGVVRGLHYQIEPRAQGKLVRVTSGAIFDVAVDIRESSATFVEWFGIELTGEEGNQLWIPPGFAHGFLALTDGAEVAYKTTDSYSPEHERTIRWDDPTIGIQWPTGRVGDIVVSRKDARAPALADAEVFA
jgi:dTDP-4-dehydrorhamnose 3,5-epimerase